MIHQSPWHFIFPLLDAWCYSNHLLEDPQFFAFHLDILMLHRCSRLKTHKQNDWLITVRAVRSKQWSEDEGCYEWILPQCCHFLTFKDLPIISFQSLLPWSDPRPDHHQEVPISDTIPHQWWKVFYLSDFNSLIHAFWHWFGWNQLGHELSLSASSRKYKITKECIIIESLTKTWWNHTARLHHIYFNIIVFYSPDLPK